MPPNRVKVSDLTLSCLKAPGHYGDETLPGLAVRVGKRRKTFIVMRHMRRKRIGRGVSSAKLLPILPAGATDIWRGAALRSSTTKVSP
jgi:hypothetical protein